MASPTAAVEAFGDAVAERWLRWVPGAVRSPLGEWLGLKMRRSTETPLRTGLGRYGKSGRCCDVSGTIDFQGLAPLALGSRLILRHRLGIVTNQESF